MQKFRRTVAHLPGTLRHGRERDAGEVAGQFFVIDANDAQFFGTGICSSSQAYQDVAMPGHHGDNAGLRRQRL